MQNMERVLLTVIQGAVDFPDPVAQKTCFTILRKLVELWGGADGPAGFSDFLYAQIIPACFLAPSKSSFDLADAQTVLALHESALCLRAALEKRGPEMLGFLQDSYLPLLHVNPKVAEEYCRALASSDVKAFKSYLKYFFQNAKT
ncbi:hypothetical protein JTE90_018432 [Oedothorax gibbosus]|uniref:Exportin-T n=1 Tax=Oedothorax gibbosus TaxID=931172 RepID=A0AAV6UZU3_9ARAC|nr:hypothetical protein JTE90_018432 [Oedothorax gibbosus]